MCPEINIAVVSNFLSLELEQNDFVKGDVPLGYQTITRSGEYDDDINFTYDTNTETYKSCSAILNNEMYVFGGGTHERQVIFFKKRITIE